MYSKKFCASLVLLLFLPLIAISQHSLYVAVNGNNKNIGSIEKPFATIAKAQHVARQLRGSVKVYLRGGTYYLQKPVVFTLEDSRLPGEEISYEPYENEKVIVSGAVRLQLLWKRFDDNIMKASVKQKLVFDEMFVDGEKQVIARYPNFDPNKKPFNGTAPDAVSKDRSDTWRQPEGGFVHALHSHEWGSFHYTIKGKDEGGQLRLEGGFQNNRKLGMHPTHKFVENIFEELDTLGEWYYNRSQRLLYFYPSKRPDNVLIEIPQLLHLFEFRGTARAPVKNITLQGLDLRHTVRTFMKTKEPLLRSDWTIYRGGAVLMEGTESCRIKKCVFKDLGGNAIFLSNYNRLNEISGNHISKAGASAICLVGDPAAVRSPSFEYHEFVSVKNRDKTPGPKTDNFPSECSITDNLIHDIGTIEKQVSGVQLSMTQSITVSSNTIYNVPRAAINIGDGTWGGHLVEFNDVFNTVLETGDHGAFNSWGRDRYWHPNSDTLKKISVEHPDLILLDAMKTTVIRNNRFRCDRGWDIDLDDGSSNYHIYNNLCLNGGIKIREGFQRVVENNIMVNNTFHPHVWFQKSEDVFTTNIVTRSYFPVQLQGWGRLVDKNLFPDSMALAQARRNGVDQNSIYGNPLFSDPSSGDFTVAANSPALQLGFKNFRMDSFGVHSPHLRHIAMSVPLPRVLERIESQDVSFEWKGLLIKNLNTLGGRSATGMSSETGVLVLNIMQWSQFSPILKKGDVILSYNEMNVRNIIELEKADLQTRRQSKIDIVVFRDQKEQTVSLENQ
jgi:hypothetical protein